MRQGVTTDGRPIALLGSQPTDAERRGLATQTGGSIFQPSDFSGGDWSGYGGWTPWGGSGTGSTLDPGQYGGYTGQTQGGGYAWPPSSTEYGLDPTLTGSDLDPYAQSDPQETTITREGDGWSVSITVRGGTGSITINGQPVGQNSGYGTGYGTGNATSGYSPTGVGQTYTTDPLGSTQGPQPVNVVIMDTNGNVLGSGVAYVDPALLASLKPLVVAQY